MAAAMEYNSPEYEAVIKGMLPYVGQIKQDLALHEALAQASLMTSEAAKRRIQAKHLQLMRPEEYVPPKEVLLYLVREELKEDELTLKNNTLVKEPKTMIWQKHKIPYYPSHPGMCHRTRMQNIISSVKRQ